MQTLILAVCGILGVLFHCCFKANSLKSSAKNATIPFSIYTYLKDDVISICASFLSVAIWLLLFAEAANRFPQIAGYARASFVLMGISGSYIIQYFASSAEKKIQSIIDHKTNVYEEVKNSTSEKTEK